MSMKVTKAKIADLDARVVAPEEIVREPTRVIRHFDLPVALHAAMAGLYLAIIGTFAVAFGELEMAIPLVIFALFVVAGFGIPALWTRMKPDHDSKPLNWSLFEQRGVDTHTGVLTARDATVQVLMLPVFILGWALITAIIAASV